MTHRNRTYPWQRRRRLILIGVALGTLLFLTPFLLFRWHTKGQVEQELARIRASGLPATPQDSAQQFPRESEESNGAELYEEAFKAKKEIPGAEDVYVTISKEQADAPQPVSFSDGLRKAIREYLEANADRLRLLHDAAKHPVSRFPLDLSKGAQLELPHLGKLRDASRLLQLEAFVAVEDGDPERAVQAILAAMAGADTLRSEPLVISQLVRCACQGIVFDTVKRVLSTAAFNDDQLARLSPAFQRTENPEMLPRMFAVERALMLTFYDHPEYVTSNWGKINEIEALFPGGTESLIRAANATGINEGDKVRYLHLSNALVEASRLPFPKMLPAMQNIEQELEHARSVIPRISTIILGGMPRLAEVPARTLSLMRDTFVALAVERYRLATDRLPPSLDGLIPLFLNEIPQDPFDGQPLRYRLLDKGYAVYSIGPNGQDDQGESAPRTSDWRAKGDLALRVTR